MIMFIFTSGVNVINFAYHIVMGRILGPSEYSIVALIISIFIISTSITSTVQTAAAKYSSVYFIENNSSKIRNLFLELTKGVLIVTFIIFIIILIFIKEIQFFLKINSIKQIILLGLMIIFGSQLSIGRGILQGIKKFVHLGINQVVENLLKFIFGIILVYLGLKSNGAALGILLGLLFAFLLVLLPIKGIITRKIINNRNDIFEKSKIDIKEFYRNILLILAITIVFSFFSYSDIILVKHFFSANEAGYYSAAIQIGKIILFFPMAVGIVILPRLSEKKAKKEKLLSTVINGLLLITAISFLLLIFYYFYSETIVKLMFGIQYLQASNLVFKYGLFMALISLINLETYYFIITDKFIYLILLIFFLIEQFTMIFIFHNSLSIIIFILLINATVLFFISLFLIFYFERKQN